MFAQMREGPPAQRTTPALDKARMLPFWNCTRGLKLTTIHRKTFSWRHRDRAMQPSVQRSSSVHLYLPFTIPYYIAILTTPSTSPLCEPPPLLAIRTATQLVGLVSPVWHLTSDQTRSLYEISGRILISIRHIAAPCSESTSGTPRRRPTRDQQVEIAGRSTIGFGLECTTVEPCHGLAALLQPCKDL